MQRKCPRCREALQLCKCGEALDTAAALYGLDPRGLSANSAETPLGLGGYDRPIERCENDAEIIARYGETKSAPTIFCAYCERSIRTRKVEEALSWFRAHECAGEGEDIEPEVWQWPSLNADSLQTFASADLPREALRSTVPRPAPSSTLPRTSTG